MNREDIIRMYAKANGWSPAAFTDTLEELERFAALVASAERESLRESFRVVTAAEASAAILHEREACADVIKENWRYTANAEEMVYYILERGQA